MKPKRLIETCVGLREDQLEKLWELKQLYGIPQAATVRRALDEYLERLKKQTGELRL